MADVFEKFKSSVNRGITTISVKTSSTLEKTKIKTHIESLNKDIEKCKFQIGEQAYAVWESGNSDYSAIANLCETIKQKKKEIEELNESLSSIDERDSQILGNTKTEYQAEQQVQPTANAATGQPAAQPQNTGGGCFCSQCGTFHEVPVKFCRQCGNPLIK